MPRRKQDKPQHFEDELETNTADMPHTTDGDGMESDAKENIVADRSRSEKSCDEGEGVRECQTCNPVVEVELVIGGANLTACVQETSITGLSLQSFLISLPHLSLLLPTSLSHLSPSSPSSRLHLSLTSLPTSLSCTSLPSPLLSCSSSFSFLFLVPLFLLPPPLSLLPPPSPLYSFHPLSPFSFHSLPPPSLILPLAPSLPSPSLPPLFAPSTPLFLPLHFSIRSHSFLLSLPPISCCLFLR